MNTPTPTTKAAQMLGAMRSQRKTAAVSKNLEKARKARKLKAMQARLIKYAGDAEGLRRAVKRAEAKAEYRKRKACK